MPRSTNTRNQNVKRNQNVSKSPRFSSKSPKKGLSKPPKSPKYNSQQQPKITRKYRFKTKKIKTTTYTKGCKNTLETMHKASRDDWNTYKNNKELMTEIKSEKHKMIHDLKEKNFHLTNSLLNCLKENQDLLLTVLQDWILLLPLYIDLQVVDFILTIFKNLPIKIENDYNHLGYLQINILMKNTKLVTRLALLEKALEKEGEIDRAKKINKILDNWRIMSTNKSVILLSKKKEEKNVKKSNLLNIEKLLYSKPKTSKK